MKKSKKLSLKKIKIASVSRIYSLKGGGITVDCKSEPCNVTTDHTMVGTECTSNTTTHTRADSIGCMSADCNNDTNTTNGGDSGNTTSPRHSIEIC